MNIQTVRIFYEGEGPAIQEFKAEIAKIDIIDSIEWTEKLAPPARITSQQPLRQFELIEVVGNIGIGIASAATYETLKLAITAIAKKYNLRQTKDNQNISDEDATAEKRPSDGEE